MSRPSQGADRSAASHAWTAILGLGSNVGDKAANIEAALRVLTRDGAIRLVARSKNYRTEPWGLLDQDWFVNAAASVATDLPPSELLARCFAVEAELGRVRKERWGPRIIDIDILVYSGVSIDTPQLVLPHPRITERDFVLVPLVELAPDLKIKDKTVRAWLDHIDHTKVLVFNEGRT